MIKRFDLNDVARLSAPCPDRRMVEEVDGDWVRYEDVAAAIRSAFDAAWTAEKSEYSGHWHFRSDLTRGDSSEAFKAYQQSLTTPASTPAEPSNG